MILLWGFFFSGATVQSNCMEKRGWHNIQYSTFYASQNEKSEKHEMTW